ncbi:MAG: monovalent cation/H+ antiporter complex subunit F [Oscillospiraceae bacterium]|nr:monovalent cation/H+ antiporter complex subunit F [Oscillospiraceae bacterium]
MEQVKDLLLTASALILAVLILATLVRAVLGPRFTDRIIAVNVINTMVVAEMAVLSVGMGEDFLVDVALVYALLSFLTVVVISRLVVTRRLRHAERECGKKTGENAHGA